MLPILILTSYLIIIIEIALFYQIASITHLNNRMKTALKIIVFFDITKDFANTLFCFETLTFPRLVNFFLSTAHFSFFAKVYATAIFLYECTGKKEYSFSIFIMVGAGCLAIRRMITYFMIIDENTMDYAYSETFESSSTAHLAMISITIYPLIILTLPIWSFIKYYFTTTFPLEIKNWYRQMIFFVFLPKFVVDNLQTRTLKYFHYLLFSSPESTFPEQSINETFVNGAVSLVIFIILYRLLMRLRRMHQKGMLREQLPAVPFYITNLARYLDESRHKDFYQINEFIIDSVHTTVKNEFPSLHDQDIVIEHALEINGEFYNFFNKNAMSKKYTLTRKVLCDDLVDTQQYIEHFFTFDDNSYEFIKEFLRKNNWKSVIPLFKKIEIEEYGIRIYGFIAIKKKTHPDISIPHYYEEGEVRYLISLAESLQCLEILLIEKNVDRFINYKVNSIQQFIQSLEFYNTQALTTIKKSLGDIKSSLHIFLEKDRQQPPTTTPKLHNAKERVIARDCFMRKRKNLIVTGTTIERTVIAQVISEDEKKTSIVTTTIPMIFSATSPLQIIVKHSSLGEKIEKILPINSEEYLQYKECIVKNILQTRINLISLSEEQSLIHSMLLGAFGKFTFVRYYTASGNREEDIQWCRSLFSFMRHLFEQPEETGIAFIHATWRLNKQIQQVIMDEYLELCSQKRGSIIDRCNLVFFINDETMLWNIHNKITNLSSITTVPIPPFLPEEENILKNTMHIIAEETEKISSIAYQFPDPFDQKSLEEIIATIRQSNIPLITLYDFLVGFHQIIIKKEAALSSEKKQFLQFDEKNESAEYLEKKAGVLKKSAFKDDKFMQKLYYAFDQNYSEIARVLGVHRSSVCRYFKKNKY